MKVAYGNDLLARADYDSSAAAASQGRHVALVVLACAVAAAVLRAAALPLDRRLEAIRIAPERLRVLRAGVAVGLVLAMGVGALVADAPRRISDARETFSVGRNMEYTPDLRDRLTSAVDNGRIENWRVAMTASTSSPARHRCRDLPEPGAVPAPPPIEVHDGHSLYLETLGARRRRARALLTRSARSWARVRAARAARTPAPARSAAVTMLVSHAGIDWDWEMPGLFVVGVRAGGVAPRRRAAQPAEPGAAWRARPGAARRLRLGVLLLAVAPGAVGLLAGAARRARSAFARGDCRPRSTRR